MAALVDNATRDQIISAFRERVCETLAVAPFRHQREVWLASDGLEICGWGDPNGPTIRLEDGTLTRAVTHPRLGGRARFLADLGAFKIGKSYGAALWASGFAAVPAAKVSLVGLEYNICEPEFSYLCEFLLSTRGMNIKARKLANSPRQGDMYLELSNGAVFECRSWERKESLKGKENDAYIFCEAYQLPGIECFTGLSQNLRARRGYAYFATTPDRPWVKLLHELGHGADTEWHCVCSIPAEANPFTFDARAKTRDRSLMTREKYEIHYEGKLGDFVGRVFRYQRGENTFDDDTCPLLFQRGDQLADRSPADRTGLSHDRVNRLRDRLRIPDGWEIVAAADTGTFYTALIVAFSPDGLAYVVDEFPNYRYVAGEPERDESMSIPRWASIVSSRVIDLGGRAACWADQNSQFKGELRNYGITLLPSKTPLETRTEIAREYFEHNRISLAPWLQILPFEIEHASWPEEATLAGKFARMKRHDHTLDCLEHILARRPMGRDQETPKYDSWAAEQGWRRQRFGNTHLGTN